MLVTCNGTDIEIDRKQVYRYLRYSAGYKPPACILSSTGEYVEHAHHPTKPAYSHIKNSEDGYAEN